jgi:hypothetical protein
MPYLRLNFRTSDTYQSRFSDSRSENDTHLTEYTQAVWISGGGDLVHGENSPVLRKMCASRATTMRWICRNTPDCRRALHK